eukprot:g1722.t1
MASPEVAPRSSSPAKQSSFGTVEWWAAYRARFTWENSQVAIVFILFVTLRAMDRVFNKRVADRMVNFQLMYVNIFWPIGVQLMTVLMCVGWVYYNRVTLGDKRYDWNFLLPGASIASAAGAYPQWRLALFSFWDQLNAVITALPSPFIDLTSQSILTNLVIVWTVLISIPYLGTRYAQEHFIGCVLVIMSGLVAVVVEMQTGNPPLGEYKTSNGILRSSSSLWFVMYIVGTIPAGISNCYKQKCLKSVDLEVMYSAQWSGYWQIVWGFLFFPLNWIPLPDPAQTHLAVDTGEFISRTMTCFFGGVPPPLEGMTNSTIQSDKACASPGGSAFVWFVVYLIFNVSFNVLLLWLTKRMSATWAAIATVLCLDITSLLSMSKVLMGSEATPVTLEQYLGLIIAGLAMWVYNLKPERDVDGKLVEGANNMEEATHTDKARWSQVSFPSDRASFVGVSESRGHSFLENRATFLEDRRSQGLRPSRGIAAAAPTPNPLTSVEESSSHVKAV